MCFALSNGSVMNRWWCVFLVCSQHQKQDCKCVHSIYWMDCTHFMSNWKGKIQQAVMVQGRGSWWSRVYSFWSESNDNTRTKKWTGGEFWVGSVSVFTQRRCSVKRLHGIQRPPPSHHIITVCVHNVRRQRLIKHTVNSVTVSHKSISLHGLKRTVPLSWCKICNPHKCEKCEKKMFFFVRGSVSTDIYMES